MLFLWGLDSFAAKTIGPLTVSMRELIIDCNYIEIVLKAFIL